jgi:DNA mismatch repair protein MutS2
MCIAFDDLCARARYAALVNGFVPEIGGHLKIKSGRHPLLDHPVAFDLELHPDEFTILVSGPNTGGKTVLIKAVGLLALLAQSGIVPPIGPQSSLPVFTEVFADIGDRQSIAASLSTFSAHVAALREILDGAGPGSLVLLDEIGSGTDPAEGGALAAATLKTLTRRRAITLATTHLGALKQLAAETVGIVNASLQFDAETLTPTYRLLKGVPGRSYGLAIARRLGVAEDVLAEAERGVPDAERTLDKLLASVEERGRELEARAADLDTRAAQIERDLQNLQNLEALENTLQAREKSLDTAARDRARAYLLEARKTVESALAQARAAVTEATAKEARRMVEEAIEKTGGEAVGRVGGLTDLAVGDRVKTAQGKVGVVKEIRSDGRVVVEVGAIRLVIAPDLLERVDPTAHPPNRRIAS